MTPSTTLKVTRKQIQKLLDATFPQYTGRKCKFVFTETLTFYDTNWAGGTRNSYAVVNADGAAARLSVPAPWLNVVEGATITLPPSALVVCRSYFCGQDMGITVYANPQHLPKWLPERTQQ